MLDIESAFAMLATSNRFAAARTADKTLRTYIGRWRKGVLSRAQKQAMLRKYGFTEVSLPMFSPPIKQSNESSNYSAG